MIDENEYNLARSGTGRVKRSFLEKSRIDADVQPGTLEERIRDAIQKELNEIEALEDGLNLSLVSFVGNGLTRIALARSNKDDDSYYLLVEGACKKAKLPPLEHLLAQGYPLDEVLGMAIRKDGEEILRDVMEKIWGLYQNLKPAPIHRALAAYSASIITTNYDPLLERALAAVSRFDHNRCHAISMAPKNKEPFPISTRDSYPDLYKIHGSLPSLPAGASANHEFDDGCFESWVENRNGLNGIIAHADPYNYWAFECSDEDFEAKFEGIIDLIEDRKSKLLILVMGLELRSEERVIWRLFQTASQKTSESVAAILALTFDFEKISPGSRLQGLFQRVNVKLGIASSSSKRELASLILLDELQNRGIIQPILDEPNKQDSFQTEFPDIQDLKELSEMSPLVVSVGQTAFHTYRGYTDTLRQEGAYSPRKASWAPESFYLECRRKNKIELMDTAHPYGDALVPCLIWDALDIPSAIVGRVGFDTEGREIINYLASNTDFLDFSYILQSNAPTEKATVACWMDLRTILDSRRNMNPNYDPYTLGKVLAPVRGGRLVYASKPGLPFVTDDLEQQDHLVFDTGGICSAGLISDVARHRSIIISSAISLLMFLDTLKFGGTKKNDVMTSEELGEIWECEIRPKYEKKEPPNETGRFFQISELLTFLFDINFDLSEVKILPYVENVEVLGCSLGPLGCIWWEKDGKGNLATPTWTYVVPSHEQSKEEKLAGQCLPLAEIRNGLGCGDASRAGFVASIILQKGRTRSPDKRPHDMERANMMRAFEAMVWAGASRVMFWNMVDFFDWIKCKRAVSLDWLSGVPQAKPVWPDGANRNRKIEHWQLGSGKRRKKLKRISSKWKKDILKIPKGEARSNKWNAVIGAWREARGI